MRIYHVEIRLRNPEYSDENGVWVYGVREVSKDQARKSVVRRCERDGYIVEEICSTTDVGKGDGWESFSPICYGMV